MVVFFILGTVTCRPICRSFEDQLCKPQTIGARAHPALIASSKSSILIMLAENLLFLLVFSLGWLSLLRFAESKLAQDEVDTLGQITSTMGAKYWKFNSNSCIIELVGVTETPPEGAENEIVCDNVLGDNGTSHVTKITLKGYNLPGNLPPQLSKLPYLQEIDFAYNYLNGSIPKEWASTNLTSISLLVNRLSGEIPKELGNIATLKFLNLEANQFVGIVPSELGKLSSLETLMLSSNQLTGNLPQSFAGFRNLTSFRINDNNFNGTIPNFIQNWPSLRRLEMHGSGLEGPIPENISRLSNLQELRISDIRGPEQKFPSVQLMTGLVRLVFRNCNISGEIPPYIWRLINLEMLDLSFNQLSGEIPDSNRLERMKFLFLTSNLLGGNVPRSILKDGSSIDLSYNHFTVQDSSQPACSEALNLNLNLFQNSSPGNNSERYPCRSSWSCSRYATCWHVNSGGRDMEEVDQKVIYKGDMSVQGGTATYFFDSDNYWGFSSTGDFMDDDNFQNTRYIASLSSSNMSDLYSTARIAPVSLSYFHYCLENGDYQVNLHFAEIQFTNDQTSNSLGKRIFNIFIQGVLVMENFNIEEEAGMALKPFVLQTRNISVTNNTLEIRFYWAGKGTTRVPKRGVYGPLISAISVVSDSKICSDGVSEDANNAYAIVGIVLGIFCLVCVVIGILSWKGVFRRKERKRSDFTGVELQTGIFTLKQIKAATNHFDSSNKIGEGGFGPVYKGILPDGTMIAVKQLSSKSKQGNREFLNEIGMISCLQHPNLVKLYGCCIEGNQLLLVYEYMVNNSLSRALFGAEYNQIRLDWPTRLKICIGIAKGLTFLHEEASLKIVHRDIKATNVLLDEELNPKISDFGLAKLDDEGKSHISTRVAGTIGYMAPEYALWGYLTDKADVYSYGVVALEIVSGRNNNDLLPTDTFVCLLDWACHLQKSGNFMELVDEKILSEVNKKEAENVARIALFCTNASPSLRPTMSEVVNMLEERTEIPDMIPEPQTYNDDLRFKAMRDLRREQRSTSSSRSQTQNSTAHTFGSSSSCSRSNLHEINNH